MENRNVERSIDVLLKEEKAFPPPPAFSRLASVPSKAARAKLAAAAARNPEKFWDAAARELHWFKPWRKTLQWKAPDAKWFVGGWDPLESTCRHASLSIL